jgi:gas vesicle protein
MGHEEGGFSTGSVFLAFLLGGVVGAGLAFLFAPQSGVETRRKIKELTDETLEKASGVVSQVKEKVVHTVEKGKDILEEKKSALSAALEAGKEAYEKEVHKQE